MYSLRVFPYPIFCYAVLVLRMFFANDLNQLASSIGDRPGRAEGALASGPWQQGELRQPAGH